MYNPLAYLLGGLRVLLVILSLILFLIPFILFSLVFGNPPARAFWVRRRWVGMVKVILGLRGHVNGAQHEGTALYVCNHRSFSDPIVLAQYINTYVIAKAEIEKIPLLGKGAKMTGVIYVKRDSQNSRSAVRQTMVNTLLDNKNVMVYPEGTTHNGLKIKEYKKGTFMEAAQNGIPVVPVAIAYRSKRDLWTDSSMMSHQFIQFGKLFSHYKLEIGPKLMNDDGAALHKEVEEWTNAKLIDIHANWKKSHFYEEANQLLGA